MFGGLGLERKKGGGEEKKEWPAQAFCTSSGRETSTRLGTVIDKLQVFLFLFLFFYCRCILAS